MPDRRHGAPRHREVDGQVLDGQKNLFAHRRVPCIFRGSKASRAASPMNTISDNRSASTQKAVMPSQGACRFSLPCLSNSPSEGEPGGRPKPRKSSEVSVTTEPEAMKGMKVRVATIALGSTWRTMMMRLATPRARAALTYSKLRARRNSARTTLTNAVHLNSHRKPVG